MIDTLSSRVRRTLIIGGSSALVLGGGALVVRNQLKHPYRRDQRIIPDGKFRRLNLAWFSKTVPISQVVAKKRGFLRRYNLDVRMLSGSFVREGGVPSIRPGLVQFIIAPVLTLIPLIRDGLKVTLLSGISTCNYRLLVLKKSSFRRIEALKGQVVGIASNDIVSQRFFSILLRRKGFDPTSDVVWRFMPEEQLQQALIDRNVQAVAGQGVSIWAMLKRESRRIEQLFTSTSGSYRSRVDQVLAVKDDTLKKDPLSAVALVMAFQDSNDWLRSHVQEVASLMQDVLKPAKSYEIGPMLDDQDLSVVKQGGELRVQIVQYIDELKLLSLIPDTLSSKAYAKEICPSVLRA